MWKTSSKDTSIEIVALLDDKDDTTSTHTKHPTPKYHRFARRKMSLEKWGQLSALIGRDMNMVACLSAVRFSNERKDMERQRITVHRQENRNILRRLGRRSSFWGGWTVSGSSRAPSTRLKRATESVRLLVNQFKIPRMVVAFEIRIARVGR
ncbi:hypothetical protein BKA60DRAFT_538428 [Fusarium oxysporum]|nr:hypothetical protein BKA60DRAFT_538428 [Fusarium oxysporum]